LTRNENDPKAEPYFPFRAAHDGLYGFFYVPSGGAAPTADTAATSVVYIDTSAPAVQITSPVDGQYLKAGEDVKITYNVNDDNIDISGGLNITFSTDGGKSWSEVCSKAAVTNSYIWK